jgi:hypothetical protein
LSLPARRRPVHDRRQPMRIVSRRSEVLWTGNIGKISASRMVIRNRRLAVRTGEVVRRAVTILLLDWAAASAVAKMRRGDACYTCAALPVD